MITDSEYMYTDGVARYQTKHVVSRAKVAFVAIRVRLVVTHDHSRSPMVSHGHS